MNTETTKQKPVLRGELALIFAVCLNSFGVVLMLYSGTGISAISSVPYAFSLVFPKLSLGTWTYLFQGLLVVTLMVLRKRFVPSYLFSFVVGFFFGKLLDVHEAWINILPTAIGWRVLYFVASYLILCPVSYTHLIIIRMSCQDISILGRVTSGVKLMNLGENESVASIAKVRELGDKDTETEGETGEPSEEGAEEALETDAELLNEDNENEEDEIARMLEERGEEDGENPEE